MGFPGGCYLGKRILIVDDASVMRVMLKHLLTSNGYQICGEAKTGADAIAKYTSLKPDLVTMDISMPDMDGVTAAQKIIDIDRSAKIVLCTALGTLARVKQAILFGAKGFLVKPLKPDKVLETLNRILNPVCSAPPAALPTENSETAPVEAPADVAEDAPLGAGVPEDEGIQPPPHS